MDARELHEVYSQNGTGAELDSYLIEITSDIFHEDRSGPTGEAYGGCHIGQGRPEGHRKMDQAKSAL